MSITPITPLSVRGFEDALQTQSLGKNSSTASPVDQLGKPFGDMLDSLTNSEVQTDNLVTGVAAGDNVDLHDLMINMEQTDIQFRVAMAIRDKLVDAYREVMRMQV